jgi:ferredoxin
MRATKISRASRHRAVDRGGMSLALVLRRRGRRIIGQQRTYESYLSPRGQMRIGQLDVDRADAENGDHRETSYPIHACRTRCPTRRPSGTCGRCCRPLSAAARDRLHTENFGSGQSMTPGIAAVPRRPPHPPAEAAEVGPLVSFTRSNLAVHWGSAFHSLLELAEACDVPVRWSCRTGVCHNCETGLISGSVIYRPNPVEPPAAGNLLICCSQPHGDIALDL